MGGRWRWIVTGAGLASIGLAHVVVIPTNADVAWLLFTAERVLEGATLYVDLIEVNPPLIVWLYMPPVAVAELLEVRSRLPFFVYVAGLVLLSLRLSWRLLGALEPSLSTDRRRACVLLLVVCFVTAVGYVYGQREHLMVLFVVPYALAVAARATGGVPSGAVLVVVGLLGGLGFTIKPYYAPAWLGLEVFCWLSLRKRLEPPGSPLREALARPELIVSVLTASAYAAAVVLFTPQYLRMGSLLAPVYVGVADTTLAALVGSTVTIVGAFALLAFALADLRSPEDAVARVFGVLLVFWLIGAVAQVKGWWYHFYPALGASFVLLGLVATAPAPDTTRSRLRRLVPGVLAALIFAGALGGRVAEAVRGLRWRADFDRKLPIATEFVRRNVGEDGNLAVLSSQLHAAFPLVNRAGVRWNLRFNAMWIPPVVYAGAGSRDAPVDYNAPEEMSPPERYFWESVLEDLAADPPEVLLIDHDRVEPPGFDYVEYFGRDSRFGRIMEGCVFEKQIGRYRAYRCELESSATRPGRSR